jgi:hypothetical protein
MDEIDSIGSARMESGNGNGDSEVQRTMLELLNQLDGFEASNKIKVIHFLCNQAIVIKGNSKTGIMRTSVNIYLSHNGQLFLSD